MRTTFYLLLTLLVIAVLALGIRRHRSAVRIESHHQTASSPVAVFKTVPFVAPAHVLPTPTLMVSNENVSVAVNEILDQNADCHFRDRAIQELGGKLSDSDRETLYQFLREHLSGDDQQLGQVLKNDLLNALCVMQPPPDGLRQLLTDIYQDSGQNEVLRDYAVQHLAAFYRQMSMATGLDPTVQNSELEQTQDVLWEAVNETSTSIAGTALLGLSQLYQQGWPGLNSQKIADTAMRLASDNGDELTQMTAFQVCASFDVTNALPTVLASVRQPFTESVQISAIAALGQLGGANEEPLLIGFIQGNDPRLKLPAQHALQKIQQRLQQQTGS